MFILTYTFRFLEGKCYYVDSQWSTYNENKEKCLNVFGLIPGRPFEPRDVRTFKLVMQEMALETGMEFDFWLGFKTSIRYEFKYESGTEYVSQTMLSEIGWNPRIPLIDRRGCGQANRVPTSDFGYLIGADLTCDRQTARVLCESITLKVGISPSG